MDALRVIWGVYALLLLAGMVTIIILGTRLRRGFGGQARMGFQPVQWQRHVARLNSLPLTWRMAGHIGLMLLGLQLVSLAVWQVVVARGLLTSDELESSWVLVQGLIFHAASLLILMVIIRRADLSWRDIFGLRMGELAKRAWQGVVGYFTVLPIFFGAALVYHLILVLLGYPLSMQDVVLVFLEPRSGCSLALHLILAIVIAPVAEEVLFRGVLLPLLMRSWDPAPAILITSLLFAIIHFHFPSLVPLFVLALAFSIAYIYTRSIVVPVVMHILFNGMNMGLLLIVASFEK